MTADRQKENKIDIVSALIVAALLGLAAYLSYAPSLANGFTFDDISTIQNNKFITDPSNISGIFTNDYFDGSGELSYRPVVTATYFLDHYLYGKRPGGYHLFSLLLHICVGFCVFLLALKLSLALVPAFLASLIFIVHPINTEVVCANAFREDLLAALFYLLAFVSFICNRDFKPKLNCLRSWTGPAFLFLALFSKEMAASFIIVIVAYVFIVFGEFSIRKTVERLKAVDIYLYGLVMMFYLAVRFFVLNNKGDEIVEYIGKSFPVNMMTMVTVIADYFRLLIWPKVLSIVYLTEPVKDLGQPAFVISCIVIGLILASAWLLRRKNRFYSFIVIAMFLMLLPVLNIIPIRHPMAERYLYLPNALFCILPFTFVGIFRPKKPKAMKVLCACVIGIAVLAGFRTRARTYDWKDNFTLWKKTVEIVPESSKAHYSLGHAWQTLKKDLPSAIIEYEKAKEIDPEDSWIRINLGMAYKDVGKYKLAEKEFLRGLKIDPDSGLLYYDLGILYGKMGLPGKEEDSYRKAIDVAPDYADAYDNLAVLLAQKGNDREAFMLWTTSVEHDPGHVRSHFNLGNYYANHGDLKKAGFYWEKTLQLDSDHQGARNRIQSLSR